MDLITLYNYQHMRNKNISSESFRYMNDSYKWEYDSRCNLKLKIMKKLFTLEDGSMYRVMLRFSLTDVYKEVYQLDQPIPFVIMRTEYTANNKGFKDTEVFHGRKAKNVLGYMKLGIPSELFDKLSKDLRETIMYK